MGAGTWVLCLALAACQRQTEYGPASQVEEYLEQVRQVLQELRVLDQQIAQVATADTLDSRLIIPLIRQQFRPAMARLHARVDSLAHPPQIEPTHQKLRHYLELRLKAYDLAIQGDRESRPELFEQFSRLQLEADTLGKTLEEELRQLRQRLR